MSESRNYKECMIHGEDCLHCGEACRLEHDTWLKLMREKEAQIATLRAGLESALAWAGSEYPSCPPGPLPWESKAKQALSSDGSEFLEAVREIIEEIKGMKNPYPEDIFKEPTHEQYLEFNKQLEQFGLIPDAYNGSTGRRVWNLLHDNTLEALSKLRRFV